jgi:hypothetical protein
MQSAVNAKFHLCCVAHVSPLCSVIVLRVVELRVIMLNVIIRMSVC